MSADRIVFIVVLAGLVFQTGVALGEYKTALQIATVCPDQPGAQLASTIRGPEGLTCIYVDHIKGRSLRRVRL